MKKYLFKRILFSILAILVVTFTVMVMTYRLTDKSLIFINDAAYNKLSPNQQIKYTHDRYSDYGYEENVNFGQYLSVKYANLVEEGSITQEEADQKMSEATEALKSKDTYLTNVDITYFIDSYTAQGFKIDYAERTKIGAKKYDAAVLVAYREFNSFVRFWNYLAHFFAIETIWDVKDPNLTDRYVRWEWDKRSNMPALVGSGTTHKYLIYFDNQFPFVHQNIFRINLGKSVSMSKNVDVMDILNKNTGTITTYEQEYPADLGTGITNETACDFHTVTYSSQVTALDEKIYGVGEHYINAVYFTSGLTQIGNSFSIGIISVILCYLFGLPLGVWMARRKDKLVDKLGNVYIIIIMSVPSLAYIFAFSAIGASMGLPNKWDITRIPEIYILPVISLALPSIGGLMKWMRRYMIDQSNADYVKFARSTGMTEREIFTKHISRNAFIYLIHGVPADILFAMVGAIITESVYAVPGIGGLLTRGILGNDNGVIVAIAIFYTFLSIIALILGDLLLAKYDPRISFTNEKGQSK